MRDIVNNIAAVQVVAPAVLTGNNTSGAVDLAGFGASALIVTTGAIDAAGAFSIKLQESDDTAGGTFADVPVDQLIGTLPETLEANAVAKIGYAGWKRYLRTVVTKAGGTSIALGAVLIKGSARDYPVA